MIVDTQNVIKIIEWNIYLFLKLLGVKVAVKLVAEEDVAGWAVDAGEDAEGLEEVVVVAQELKNKLRQPNSSMLSWMLITIRYW